MLDNLTTKQKKILGLIAIIIGIGIIYFIYSNIGAGDNIELDEDILVSSNIINESNSKNITENTEDLIVIHITGAVKNPGVVKLVDGSRMEDAIEAAGGLLEDADISQVNLAYVLDDGVKIRIPYLNEENTDDDILSEDNGNEIIQDSSSTSTSSTETININKATETELEVLPGIGPSLASRIVEYREENGNFSSIEDIKNVSGIGDSKYENIKDYISVK